MTDEPIGPEQISSLSRRELLAAISAVGAAAAFGIPERATALAPPPDVASTVRRAAATRAHGSDLGAVDHIVFLMMENRSYDHYFGAYHKGRGFDDHPKHSLGAFAQRYPGGTKLSPRRRLLPFHLPPGADEDCTRDLSHNWGPQHLCWNHGRMNRFVETHTKKRFEGDPDGALTMGYYTRRDLPFYYALADHFTLGDRYHCSILGPTHPNRLMAQTGTIDPAGRHGGPVTDTSVNPAVLWTCTWTTVQELLEDKGISWKVYSPSYAGLGAKYSQFPTFDNLLYNPSLFPLTMAVTDHVLPYFKAYQDPNGILHRRAFGPTYPNDFVRDIRRGKLPHVSWIIPPAGFDEHPAASPDRGMWFTKNVLDALMSNKKVWSRTALFLMHDENDGFFDHVRPPTAPRGTHGEWLTAKSISPETMGIRGPLGLGVRVPFLVLSPFSRGGHITSHLFDHTSQLLLLEERFGIHVSNLSKWRRRTVNSLEKALFHGKKDMSMPALPHVPLEAPTLLTGNCSELKQDSSGVFGGTGPTIPTKQRMPTQHGTTVSARRYFKESATTVDRVPATSGRNTATKKSAYNHLVHGGQPVASRENQT
jgi:phospholipase C